MSSQISIELVKELRDATGISVMQCKKALEEAEGNMEKALAILKKTSSDIALKKADRTTADGALMVQSSGKKTALVVLYCETDFVSKNEDFVNLLTKLTEKTLNDGVEAMKAEAKESIDLVIQKTGENIQLGNADIVEGETVASYVHNNKIAVIVSLEGGNEELAKDIAMHVAAMKPEYITREEIDSEAQKTMAEIFEKENAQVDKPEEIKKKILEGKIATYFKERTLMDQPFIKNPEETIAQILGKASAKIKEVKLYSIK